MATEEIFIQLLDEGTTSYRPVQAEMITGNIYKILHTNHYDQDSEKWEFIPGQIVQVEEKMLSDFTMNEEMGSATISNWEMGSATISKNIDN